MAQRTLVNIVYDGPALRNSEMDVKFLAPALLALGEVFDRANELLNGDRARLDVKVNASFRSGSFGIELALDQTLVQKLFDALNGEKTTALINLVTLLGFAGAAVSGGVSLLGLLKKLGGRKVTKSEVLNNGKVAIYIDDERIEVDEAIAKLLMDYKVRKAIAQAVEEPLGREGIDHFYAVDGPAKNVIVEVTKSERSYFSALEVVAVQSNIKESEMFVVIHTPALAGGKWKFTDGQSSFFAEILDRDFLRQVDLHEARFGKDDKLLVHLRTTQTIDAEGTLKSQHEILKVVQHQPAPRMFQESMDLPPSDGSDPSGKQGP